MSPKIEAYIRGGLKMVLGFGVATIAYYNADVTPTKLEFLSVVVGPFVTNIIAMLDRSPRDVWDGKEERRN